MMMMIRAPHQHVSPPQSHRLVLRHHPHPSSDNFVLVVIWLLPLLLAVLLLGGPLVFENGGGGVVHADAAWSTSSWTTRRSNYCFFIITPRRRRWAGGVPIVSSSDAPSSFARRVAVLQQQQQHRQQEDDCSKKWQQQRQQQQRRIGPSVVRTVMMASSGSGSNENSNKSQQQQHAIDNILEDDTGHINRELAERIWNWEQVNRKDQKLPKVQYSIRSGLRLVDELVDDILQFSSSTSSSSSGSNSNNRQYASSSSSLQQQQQQQQQDNNNKDMYYGDLIQEGLSALLDAMSTYRSQDHSNQDENNEQDDFEEYARKQISNHLTQALDEEARPIPLPKNVQSIVQQATQIIQQQQQQNEDDRKLTLTQVADRLGLPTNQLRDYLKLAKSTGRKNALSMETTIEIWHPYANLDDPAFQDQEQWELNQNMVLDNGRHVYRDELIEEYIDDNLRNEGDDDSWVQQEQIAGPLTELIPDLETGSSESSNDLVALEDLIRSDLSAFLSSTLNNEQLQVVRMCFGLQQQEKQDNNNENDTDTSSSGKLQTPTPQPPMSVDQIAEKFKKSKQEVGQILRTAVEQLRKEYKQRYYQDDDDDDNVEGAAAQQVEDSV